MKSMLGWILVIGIFLSAGWPCAAVAQEKADDDAERAGYLIRVSVPIDAASARRVRAAVDNAMAKTQEAGKWPVLIFEFDILPGADEYGRGSDFGISYGLADFISTKLSGATTVAYLPKTIQGHAVLVALACDEIIMHPDAEIGNAGIDEEIIKPAKHSAYREIAEAKRPGLVELVLGMLDPAREVIEVRTKLSTAYVTPDELEELRKTEDIKSEKVVIAAGEAGQFTAAEARKLNLADYQAAERRELVDALDLPGGSIIDDPTGGDVRAKRVDLRGPISSSTVRQVQKIIENETKLNDVNFICLYIESPGGSPSDSMSLASFLAEPGMQNVRVVAYIPKEARADAALVAMGCDEVVMHPRAVLGGPGAYQPDPEEIDHIREAIRNSLSKQTGRSWSMIAALIDPNLEVFRCRRLGDVGYFSEEELEEPALKQGKWKKEQRITTAGVPLQLDGDKAKEYGLANHVVENFRGFKEQYGLSDDPALVAPGWADEFIEILTMKSVAIMLLLIGGTALYVELQMPGIGIGGFLATVCFVLFFWSNYIGGTADLLEVMLFLLGIACVALEIFVLPGFGIFGLGGGLLILASLILASQTFVLPRNAYQYEQLNNSLFVIVAASAGMVGVGLFMRRWLPHAPLFGKMFLHPPVDEEAEEISHREALLNLNEDFIGSRGTTTTQLTPGGKARFGDRLLDVMTDGEVVERGTEIEVVEVHGNHLVVRTVDG